MGYNLNIDTIKAMNWKRMVDQELEAVERVLDGVYETIQEQPDQEDPLMSMIWNVGNSMADSWNKLTESYKDLQNRFDTAIKYLDDKTLDNVERLKRLDQIFKR